jgi:hypothetical protein
MWMQFQTKDSERHGDPKIVVTRRKSTKERTGGYLGNTGDEGRSKLR